MRLSAESRYAIFAEFSNGIAIIQPSGALKRSWLSKAADAGRQRVTTCKWWMRAGGATPRFKPYFQKNLENDFSGFLLGNQQKKWGSTTYGVIIFHAKMPG